MKTVLIMSRDWIAPWFKAMAAELAKDHRVIVAINTFNPDDETILWHGFKDGILLDFYGRIQQAVSRRGSWSVSEIGRIEEEIGVPLYQATSNFQLYRRLFKSFVGPWPQGSLYCVEDDIAREYVGSYLVLEDIFKEYAPDVVFYETVDTVSAFVTLGLCHHKGIFSLGYRTAPAFESVKICLTYGVYRHNPILEHLCRHPDIIDPESRQTARNLLSRLNQETMTSPWYVQPYHKNVEKPLYRNPRQLLRRLRNLKFWPPPLRYLKKMRNLSWLESHSHKAIPEEPYIAFFLHHQPEASTCAAASRWVDQDRIIEQLAINAPYGLKILIKENPRTYWHRGKDYFGPLLEIPNVYMCHPAVNTFEVAKRAEAILAIAGSIGLESIIMGKRVAVLGNPYYSIYPGVKKLNYPEEIFAALKDPSWQPQEQERENFTAAYLASLHHFGPVPPGQIWPPPAMGGAQLAQALRNTMGFIKTHNLKPADFNSGLAA